MKNYYILFLLSLLGLDAMAQQGYNEMATPKRLGAFINTSAEESLPLLSADGKDLYFFRTFEEYNYGGVNDQDIWVCSKNEKGNWEEAYNVQELNNRDHNAVVALGQDGNSMYVLFSNGIKNENKGLGKSTKSASGLWSKPVKIEIPELLITGANFGFTVSKDEKVVIISYAGPTSKGQEDLYYSLNTAGVWSSPKSLGDNINSNGYEISPFLSPNSDTLYFASNGLGGEGDCDIFYSVKKSGWGDWSIPVNMGNKINSPNFDAYLVKYGKTYYWSSNRNAKEADIYFTEQLTPPALEISETHANITAFGGSDGTIDVVVKSGVAPYKFAWSNGKESEDLAQLKRGIYEIMVTDVIGQKKSLTIELTEPAPIVQKVIRLPEVRYTLGSWEFVNDATIKSTDSLDKVAQLLTEYPGMQLELISHTDARGDDKKNKLLSENRAKAVYKYLVETKGIDPRRLVPKGKGELDPAKWIDERGVEIILTEAYINLFKTTDKEKFEGLHQVNRRTEGKVIGLDFNPETAPQAPKEYLIFNKK
jgi:outer membrane protein OmpA-like peptidoglycan-associated protein